MPSAERPSGQQVELRHGSQRAIVVEVGGGLRSYSVDDRAVLDGYAVDRMADGGRGQPLLPWPNRLADGQYTWDGRHLQVPIDELGRRNASHGLTRWLNWSIRRQSKKAVTMQHVIHPRPGYPFTLQVEIDYELGDAGLTVRTHAHNVGSEAAPFGLGFHPYLTVGTPSIDSAQLLLPAAEVLDVDERMLPTGTRRSVANTELDFRIARCIGEQRLDHCYSGLERDDRGRARVVLCAPDDGPIASLWLDASFTYVQVFTGDTLAEDRRRQGIAIEPMTCPPNAFRSGTDVARIQPGEAFSATWGASALRHLG